MSAPARRPRPPSSAVLRPSSAQPSSSSAASSSSLTAGQPKLARAPSSANLASSNARRTTAAATASATADDENGPPARSGTRTVSGKAAPAGAAAAGRRERVPTSSSSSTTAPSTTPAAAAAADVNAPSAVDERKPAPAQEGTNIEVVVRCRGRSAKEIAENSPIIVSTAGALGTSLTIETQPISTSSSLSLLSAPTSSAGGPTRTYTFDRVFGPEADQKCVWDEVVGETLDEVLAGYNCTIFAYGQTGTGKTYTMQGDLVPTTLGNPSSEAGIVPRTLHRLFAALETNPNVVARESSVRCSFVEIYNEDIRDLLAHTYVGSAAQAALHQPMGAGSSAPSSSGGAPSSSKTAAGGSTAPPPSSAPVELKIYEDPSPKGRGVVIQGLEELGVRSAAHGIELLRKGSARRETGETLMNATSSRSHSIFSITVHVKETSATGEDLLKVGKLNLVDLAGSENIGRSGAVESRAREAGMINQSLLTLGRVINSLVKKSSHVPYRESKLTRLLQDSLGGRTKTRIVATISPSRSNLDETLSTIDYATRATRILNRPEVNLKMTRNGLISEYVAEIEGLKKDLLASREKNGIYITSDDYAQLTEDAKLHATQLDEAKSRHVILSNRLAALAAELEETSVKLLTTEELRLALAGRLEEIARELEVERRAVEVFEQGEERVDGVAQVYRGAFGEATGDLDGLFAKKDRTTAVLASNASAGATHAARTLASADALGELAGGFAAGQRAALGGVGRAVDELQQRRAEHHRATSSAIATGSSAFGTSTAQVEKYLDRAHAEHGGFRLDVTRARGVVEAAVGGQAEGVKRGLVEHEGALRSAVGESLGETRRVADALGGFHNRGAEIAALGPPLRAIVDDKDSRMRAADAEDVDRLTEASALIIASLTADHATRRSAAAAAHLARTLAFHAQMLALQQTFEAQASAAFDAEVEAAEGAFEAALAGVQGAFDEVRLGKERRAKKAEEEQRGLTDGLGELVDGRLQRAAEDIQAHSLSLQADFGKAVSQTEDSIASGLSALTQCAVELIDTESAKITHELAAIARAADAAGAGADKTLKKQRIALKTSRTGVDELLRAVEGEMRDALGDVETSSAAILSSVATLDASAEAFSTAHASAVAGLRESTTAFQTAGLREDAPTGTTPRKRAWDHVPRTWERTGSLAQVKDRLRATVAEAATAGDQGPDGTRLGGTVSPVVDDDAGQ